MAGQHTDPADTDPADQPEAVERAERVESEPHTEREAHTEQAGPAGPGDPPAPGGTGPTEPAAAPPPPGGDQRGTTADETPPLTAFAWRNGLVRPVEGRLLAGVCGALGRGTNTDPVLWRVLIAVLSIFGGIGLLVYLLGWLLLPADGDTGSPIEALLGRGRSSTSAAMTVVGGGIALVSFAVFFSEPFRPGPWGVLLLGGVVLLLLRDRRRARPAEPSAAPGGTAATAAFAPHGPYAARGSGAAAPTGAPATPMAATAPAPATGTIPPLAPPPAVPPHLGPPMGPPTGPLGRPMGRPGRPPRRPRSRLGALTLSMTLLVVGAVGLVDLAGYSVPAAGYLAAALATVGLGLVLGAWVGRSRGLVALGLALALALGMAAVVDRYDSPWWRAGGSVTFVPSSLADLQDGYEARAADLQLDLREIDFAESTEPVHVEARVGVGNLLILLPPDVDATVTATVDVGNAVVFQQSWQGLGLSSRTVTDTGTDGGGEVRIDATVGIGNLEVRR